MHSSLGDSARFCLKKKKVENKVLILEVIGRFLSMGRVPVEGDLDVRKVTSKQKEGSMGHEIAMLL